jgi:hypothetical protein
MSMLPYPKMRLTATQFFADLLSNKTVSGAKVRWHRWCMGAFCVGFLALALESARL